jgi:hypothetical protein
MTPTETPMAWGDRRLLAEKVERLRVAANDLVDLTAFPPYLPESERELWLVDAAKKLSLVLNAETNQ